MNAEMLKNSRVKNRFLGLLRCIMIFEYTVSKSAMNLKAEIKYLHHDRTQYCNRKSDKLYFDLKESPIGFLGREG